MTGFDEIRHRAAVVEDAARVVQAARAAVEGLGALRWRSPAALAFRTELAHVGDDLDRSRVLLLGLAGDLRMLATLVARGRRG